MTAIPQRSVELSIEQRRLGGFRYRVSCRRCFGFRALVSSLNHEALRLVSDGVMPDRMGKKEEGVLRRQPVITLIDSFKATLMCFVWALPHHTGAQYCAGANASVKQEVLRALKFCNLSGGVALIVWFILNGICVKNNTIIYAARASNSKRDCEHDLCCCLLPWCEALRTCRLGFPIATKCCMLKRIKRCLQLLDWQNQRSTGKAGVPSRCKKAFCCDRKSWAACAQSFALW